MSSFAGTPELDAALQFSYMESSNLFMLTNFGLQEANVL